MDKKLTIIISFIITLAFSCNKTFATDNKIVISCNQDNDLYQMLVSNDIECRRYEDIGNAIKHCDKNGTLLVLAKNYPKAKTVIPDDFYMRAREKNLKVFIEFPDRLESGITGEVKQIEKERLVVTSDFFQEDLSTMSILDAGRFFYVEVEDRDCHIKGANVAGFKSAVYGLKETVNFPILFENSGVLVSTIKLSDFNKSRYSPINSWEKVLGGILSYLSVEISQEKIVWEPVIKPTYDAVENLPSNANELAVKRGVEWYINGKFLIHHDWQEQWKNRSSLEHAVGPPMDLELPSGDGSLGVMEGQYSYINPDGRQPYRYVLRSDCVGETAMTFAISSVLTKNKKHAEISTNILDFTYNTDAFRTPDTKDPGMSTYGLIGWTPNAISTYYGDNCVKVILGAILTASLTENSRWDSYILKHILANFRTTGKNGFRGNALTGKGINNIGWRKLMEQDLVNPAPHYEAWIWATYLWLYDKTGYKPLLERTKKAINITMQAYPEEWIWTNGIQQERARMILPLAWLVRIEDTKQHREWLDLMCNDLLANQVDCGAIREELGNAEKGKYGAPKGNKNYGTAEAPAIHSNEDAVADMLYTSNFAFFALNEAAWATNNPKYLNAVNKLSDFLLRIQTSSKEHADLDGCWFRSFDYESWEYYGANADLGWGAWTTITGWTQSFIITTLGLNLKETSYWDITKDSKIGSDIEAVWSQMLPNVKH